VKGQPAQGITAEQFRAVIAQLATRQEAKKRESQRKKNKATLELAFERIRRNDAEQES
jgi:hypothetical protein